jgi:hypothetical protein
MENMLGLLIAVGAFSALVGHWLMELPGIARQDLPGRASASEPTGQYLTRA